MISVRVLAVSPNVKALGYEAAAYYTPTKQRDDIELIVSEVAEEVNWKICADLSVQKIQAGAKVGILFPWHLSKNQTTLGATTFYVHFTFLAVNMSRYVLMY